MAAKKRLFHKDITAEALAKACASLPICVPAHVLPTLETYLTLLMRWNAVMNLVGARTWQSCLQHLIIDSFYLADFMRTLPMEENPEIWDLGAGAGLPGIPLRMLWHTGTYNLIEVREKRALFLSTALAQLMLPQTSVFQGRAEDFFMCTQNAAHIVISRAFMPWQQVLSLVQEHIRSDGRVIFLTLEPVPQQHLPQPWFVEAEYVYTVSTKTAEKSQRYFWALRRV